MNEFAEQMIDAERFASLPPQEQNDICWRAGYLRPKFDSLQQTWYDKYRPWAAQDLYAGDVEFVAGSFPRVFGMEVSKRVGKTTFSFGIRHEDCVRNPGTKYRITTAFEKSAAEIISDIFPPLFASCPPDVRPKYFQKRGAKPAGFYYPEWGPAAGSVIYIAGLEKNPDALRGQACDGDNITEAAFIADLLYAVKNVLYHQYQGRPWARLLMETSAPEDIDTAWERNFLPDCKRRGAHVVATLEDNPRMPRREKDEFIAAAGGRGHPDCEREYFNVIQGNPETIVVPEFKKHEQAITVASRLPNNCMALTAADPGQRHLFALVFGYVDFDRQCGVIQDSWARSNPTTRRVAAVCAAREFDLWGTWPADEMRDIPLESEGQKLGWKDLLAGDRCADFAEDMYRMAQTPESERPDFNRNPDHWKKHYPPGHLCWWDGARFRTNPKERVSDVDLSMISTINAEFGLEFAGTTKDILKTVMVADVRNMIGGAQLFFEPTAGPVLDHTRAANWDKQHKRFAEHDVYGHYDALAALVYWVRRAKQLLHLNPHPPVIQQPLEGTTVIDRLPWQKPPVSEQVQAINQLLGFDANGGRSKRRGYGYL